MNRKLITEIIKPLEIENYKPLRSNQRPKYQKGKSAHTQSNNSFFPALACKYQLKLFNFKTNNKDNSFLETNENKLAK
jgi:hypothetical protein